MASTPAGPTLDGPPPSPVNPPSFGGISAGAGSPGPGAPGAGASPGAQMSPEQAQQAMTQIYTTVKQAILALAKVAGQVGAKTNAFSTAAQALDQGFQAILAASGSQNPGGSPTATGSQFPGAGVSNA